MKFIRIVLPFIFFALFASSLAIAGRSNIKVLILPFDIHAESDLSGERRDVMEAIAYGLDKDGVEVVGLDEIKELYLEKGIEHFDEEMALNIGKETGADFALLGSLTLIGDAYSIDMRLMDTRSAAVVGYYYKGVESLDAQALDDAAESLRNRMNSLIKKKPAAKEGVIKNILVMGTKRVDGDAVERKLLSKAGEVYSSDNIREDIHRIYGMGWFDDISVELSDVEGGVEVVYAVREKPYVKKITLKGNKELKDEKIKEVFTLKENTILDPVIIKENAERIKALYAQEGYYLAEVESKIVTEEITAAVIFDIKEGERVRIKRIEILGNSAFSDRKIKKLMAVKETGRFSFITGSGSFNEYTFEQDLDAIVKHYLDNGYIQFDIKDFTVLLSEDRRWFYITVAVNEGERFRVGEVDITGDVLKEKKFLLKKLKIKKGEVFNKGKLAKGIETLNTIYGDEGFANAEFVPKTKIDVEKKTVDIIMTVQKKEPVYIERIDISGNVNTRDKVIRREIELGEGDLYSSTAIKRSKNNLRRLGYFEEVNIGKSAGTKDDKIKLDVDVKERPTGQLTFGVGYSSVDKLMATASISQSNLMGTGLKLDFSGSVSATSSKYMLSFTEPWLFDKPLSAGIDLFDTSREYPDFTQDRRGFNLRFGFPLYKRTTRGYLTYKLEEVKIGDVSATAPALIQSQEGKSTVSSVNATVKRDTRDDIFFPTEGDIETVSTEVAGGMFGGATNYAKYELNAIKYFPLPYNMTFSVRGMTGYVHSFEGQEVPIYERYFLGGINTIRGFETRTISPKDPLTGELIGGDKEFFVNTEILFPLLDKNMRGVIFFDAGNSYVGSMGLGGLKQGAGIGLRWFTPLGPLRIEWGYNLDPENGERQSIWEFTIGSFF